MTCDRLDICTHNNTTFCYLIIHETIFNVILTIVQICKKIYTFPISYSNKNKTEIEQPKQHIVTEFDAFVKAW